MADAFGLPADVYFGDPGNPLPDWRRGHQAHPGDPGASDDDDPTPEERRAVIAMLGFDPREIDDEAGDRRGGERMEYARGETNGDRIRRMMYDRDCGCDSCTSARAETVRHLYGPSTPMKSEGGRLVSSRSKTGDPKCSAAVSAWKTGHATPETHHQLALCRNMARSAGQAHLQRAAGHEARAQHIEHLLASKAPLGSKARGAKAAELQGQRGAARGVDPAEFAGRVHAAADQVGAEGQHGANGVLASHVRELYRRAHGAISDADFRAKLREAHAGGHLNFLPMEPSHPHAPGYIGAKPAVTAPSPAPEAPAQAAGKVGSPALRAELAAQVKDHRNRQRVRGEGRNTRAREVIAHQLATNQRIGDVHRAEDMPPRGKNATPKPKASPATPKPLTLHQKAMAAKAAKQVAAAPPPTPATPAEKAPEKPSAPAPSAFGLKQESAAGTKKTTFENTGAGRTGTMFDMKRGDLPGQTSLMDRFGTVDTHAGTRPTVPATQATSAQERRALGRVLPKMSGGSPAAVMERARTDTNRRGKLAGRIERLRSEVAKARRDPASHTEHAPGTITPLNTNLIHSDPERFQYKLGHAAGSGSVGSLASAETFNPDLAGVVQVWKDPGNGKVYVVNGHNRLDKARQAGAPKLNVQFISAPDAEAAKAKGALKNIAGGRGTSIDAANFFMNSGIKHEDLARHGIPMKDRVATEGLALANLHPRHFRRVIEGSLSQPHAALVGGAGLSHAQQDAVIRHLDRAPKSRPVSLGQLRETLENAREAPSVRTKTFDLFGPNEEETSLAFHRGKVQEQIRDRLSREKRLFGTVAKSKAAEDLARGGNVINASESGKIAHEAGNTLDVFDMLKNKSGTIAPLLNRAAERIHAGEHPRTVIDEAYGHVLEAARSELA